MPLSETPNLCRFVASPRRNACQPYHGNFALSRAGRMTSAASASKFVGLHCSFAKINPLNVPTSGPMPLNKNFQGSDDRFSGLALWTLRIIHVAPPYGLHNSYFGPIVVLPRQSS